MTAGAEFTTRSTIRGDAAEESILWATDSRSSLRFSGKFKRHAASFRRAIATMADVVLLDSLRHRRIDRVNPIITVQGGRLVFEALSYDQSAFAMLLIDSETLESEGETCDGSAEIDFSRSTIDSLDSLKWSGRVQLHVGRDVAPPGVEVHRAGKMSSAWRLGWRDMHTALAMLPNSFEVENVDLLRLLRILPYSPGRSAPDGLRYVFEPGQVARLIVEPWETAFDLVGATHRFTEPATLRTFGAERLTIIEKLLPYAEQVNVYLLGTALPSFYALQLPGMTFVFGINGAMRKDSAENGFGLWIDLPPFESALVSRADAIIQTAGTLSPSVLAEQCSTAVEPARAALVHLCRQGKCFYDLAKRVFRHRAEFADDLDSQVKSALDERRELANAILDENVQVLRCEEIASTHQVVLREPLADRHYGVVHAPRCIIARQWQVIGTVDDLASVEIRLAENHRLEFGRCPCLFFAQHGLTRGPCEHMRALYRASKKLRTDRSTSIPFDEEYWPLTTQE